jgi:hypothetical protein
MQQIVCNLMMTASWADFERFIRANRRYCQGQDAVIKPDSHKGQKVAVCAAGPSLHDCREQLVESQYDQVWGCNSALNYLWDSKLPLTHAITVDQSLEMLSEQEFGRCLDVPYYLASSVHPMLTRKLHRRGRQLIWFHNYIGMENPKGWQAPEPWATKSFNANHGFRTKEMWLYETLWPSTAQVGYGLNTGVRAVIVAMFMGPRCRCKAQRTTPSGWIRSCSTLQAARRGRPTGTTPSWCSTTCRASAGTRGRTC